MDHDHSLGRAVVARAAAVVALGGIALIHLLDATSKFKETPYMGWMYVGLIAGSVAVAASFVHRETRMAWAAAGALAVSAMVGYTLTRTVGLPHATGDIGNWGEPLGMASLFVEACLVALSAYRLAGWRTGTEAVARRRPTALVS